MRVLSDQDWTRGSIVVHDTMVVEAPIRLIVHTHIEGQDAKFYKSNGLYEAVGEDVVVPNEGLEVIEFMLQRALYRLSSINRFLYNQKGKENNKHVLDPQL